MKQKIKRRLKMGMGLVSAFVLGGVVMWGATYMVEKQSQGSNDPKTNQTNNNSEDENNSEATINETSDTINDSANDVVDKNTNSNDKTHENTSNKESESNHAIKPPKSEGQEGNALDDHKHTPDPNLDSNQSGNQSVKPPILVNVKGTYDVGVGIIWPEQVHAPYVDMVRWVTKEGYHNQGAPNLVKFAEDTGIKFYHLGFVQAVNREIKNGKINWGWGGYGVLSESGSNDPQYLGIKQSIKGIRALGGDVAISVGGLMGTAFWEVTQDVDILAKTYLELVEGYGLTRLDLDIEGSAQNKQQNSANAKAIKKVQQETGVQIILTLPVQPTGLTPEGVEILGTYLTEGVEVHTINLMTMCYGPGTLLPHEDYGSASVRAVDSTKEQVKKAYSDYVGISLTNEQVYRKLGTTPSIGYEGSGHPIFPVQWAEVIVNHAIEKGLGFTGYWSMNRDAQVEENMGIAYPYGFANVFKVFGESTGINKGVAPIIRGANATTIALGQNFRPMEGVSVIDQKDGDLTKSVHVSGMINPNIAGTYELTYSVTNSQGITTVCTRQIFVGTNQERMANNSYEPSKVYNGGDQANYNGQTYRAKWWTQGENPTTSEVWEIVP